MNCEKQGRINHWANRANARGFALEYQSTRLLVFMFLGCSPCVKLIEFFVTALTYDLRKLTTLAFIVVERLKRIQPNSTKLYGPKN